VSDYTRLSPSCRHDDRTAGGGRFSGAWGGIWTGRGGGGGPCTILVVENVFDGSEIAWIRARTAQEKLDHGFGYGRYPWERGEVVRYNTAVTFTLASAMDTYLKRKEGPNAYLWDMVVDEVYGPIGILRRVTCCLPHPNSPIPNLGLQYPQILAVLPPESRQSPFVPT
jgi:hypothetical protein